MRPTIVVTRPEPAAGRLAAALTARGFEVIRCPVIELAPPQDPAGARRRLAAALPADGIIFVSPAAVDGALELLPRAHFAGAWVAAPGAGTAARLRRAGFPAVRVPATRFTSEALLELPAMRQVERQCIVICNDPGGRDLLLRVLRRRGARVREVAVYRRLPRPPAAGTDRAIMAAPALITVITSRAVMSALQAGLEQDTWRHLLAHRLLVSSSRLARQARAAGFRRVEVSAGADDESVIAALAANAC